MDVVGWIVVGLLVSVTAESIMWATLGAFVAVSLYRFVVNLRPR